MIMYSTESYIWGWVAYSAGVFCLLGLFWLLIRKMSIRWVRQLLFIAAMVIFFTPVTAYPDNPYWAPAIFVSLYEGLLLSDQSLGFQRGLAPILAVGFISVVLYLLITPFLGRQKKLSSVIKTKIV